MIAFNYASKTPNVCVLDQEMKLTEHFRQDQDSWAPSSALWSMPAPGSQVRETWEVPPSVRLGLVEEAEEQPILKTWSPVPVLADAAPSDCVCPPRRHPFPGPIQGVPQIQRPTLPDPPTQAWGTLAPGLVEGARAQGQGSSGSWAAYRASV